MRGTKAVFAIYLAGIAGGLAYAIGVGLIGH
jgi:hypothetical protein